MKATRIDPPVVVQPPTVVTLEMSLAQAKTLKRMMYWTMTVPGAIAHEQDKRDRPHWADIHVTDVSDLMGEISTALYGVVS